MPVDLLWVTVGFVVGVGATAIALEVAFRRVRNEERASLTKDWDFRALSTDGPPSIVATSLEGSEVPPNSKVIVSPGARLSREVAKKCKLRIHPDVKGNFAAGSGHGILCTGPMVPGTLAMTTVHPALVDKLERSFDSLWVQARPYTEEIRPSQIPANQGSFVKVKGRVKDILTSGDTAILTLENPDGSGRGDVLVPANLPVEKGKGYEFAGTVVNDGNRPQLKAEDVSEVEVPLKASA